MAPHIPVLAQEILDAVANQRIPVMVDGTLGAGGHALLLLEAHPEIELLVGGDQDPTALELARGRLGERAEVQYLHTNFVELGDRLKEREILASLILLDLGVSSMQLDQPMRGFSFQQDGPLDMRMNPHQGYTAEQIVMGWPEEQLCKIFWEYGEEPKGRQAARAIVQARKKGKISTTGALVEALEGVLIRRGPMHPCTRIFQALRLAVNEELHCIEQGLPRLAERLAPDGILAVISFHSLEDRLVKWGFRSLAETGEYTILTKKPIEPSLEETRQNRRSRSAKLRLLRRTMS